MRVTSIIKSAVFISAMLLESGCMKESLTPSKPNVDNATLSTTVAKAKKPQQHKLKGEFSAGYYSFVGDSTAGYIPPNPAPGWYPGVATVGHINLIGKSQAFVNMYASFGPTGLQGEAASLNLFFTPQLNAMGISLPNNVAIFIFDKQGNSIWARGTGIISITPVSATRVTFSGNAEILGGTGKFSNATGSFTLSGFFNPQNYNDVGLEAKEGTIVY